MIYLVKFVHILFAIGLLGITIYCLSLVGPSYVKQKRLNKLILIMSPVAVITGTLLVHPKGYTFHTPWIQAAYLLLIIFCLGIFLLLSSNKIAKNPKISLFLYLILISILIVVMHDAVTKRTLFSLAF